MAKQDKILQVAAAQSGDRDAFGQLIEAHRGMVFGVCYRVTDNVHDAEDLAHEAFVEAYVKLHTLREPAKFAAWLRTLALNLCRMWYRRRQRDALELWEEPPAVADTPNTDQSELAQAFCGLGQLSLPHRLAIILHCLEGLSYSEVATFLGVPVGTVMSRLHRARQQLRKRMHEMSDIERIPMIDEKQFQKEVDAEIALLLEVFHEEPAAMERLSVILKRSPARVGRLLDEPTELRTLDDLALLLPRLGAEALGIVLDAYLDSRPLVRENALHVLRRFISACRSECGGIAHALGVGLGDMASFDAYVCLDQLIARLRDTGIAAGVAVELMDAVEDAPTGQLLGEVALCLGEDALDELTGRFWRMETLDHVHRRSNWTLQALRNVGDGFLRELQTGLQGDESLVAGLALAGMDAFASGLGGRPTQAVHICVPGARFITETTEPALVALVQLDADVVGAAADAASQFITHADAKLRNTAIRILERLRGREHVEALRPCLEHPNVSTRVRTIQALAGLGDRACADAFMARARNGETSERRAAIAALGRLGIVEAKALLVELIEDGDAGVRKAAIIAVGELGRDDAEPVLRPLLASPDKTVRRAASSALFGMDRGARKRPSAGPKPGPRYPGEGVRMPAARRAHYISVDAAIRALPELRTYEEREITERISHVCGDWATTRRKLVEFRLLRRPGNVYEFTELGKAVWRVEHFIMERYLKVAPPNPHRGGAT